MRFPRETGNVCWTNWVIRSSLLSESSFWRMIFNEWWNCFSKWDYIFKLNKSSKNSTDRDCTHRKALRSNSLKVRKLFSKIICIFRSVLIVRCTFESCQNVEKASRSWAMSMHWIYLHDKTTIVKKICLKFLGYSPPPPPPPLCLKFY